MTAQGGEYGAGIGGGDESTGPQMEIYGGEINATGGDKGAGIGGGCNRGAASIIIWGGTVHAKGGLYAAGIGEGYDASSGSSAGLIVIRNCEFIGATGGNMAAGIGGGYYNNTEIKIYIFGGKKIIAYGGSNNDTGAAGIGFGSFKEISAVHGEGGDFGGYIYIGGGEVQAYGTGTYASFTGTNSGAAGLGAGYGGNMTGIIEITGGTVAARGAYGEVVGRYTETIPATGEPDTPDEPTDPTNPDTPSGDNICKWDNVDHGTSFWGRLVKFFHSVLYFFAHLFGKK